MGGAGALGGHHAGPHRRVGRAHGAEQLAIENTDQEAFVANFR